MFLLKMLSANYRMRRRAVLAFKTVKVPKRRLLRHLKRNMQMDAMSYVYDEMPPADPLRTFQFIKIAPPEGY